MVRQLNGLISDTIKRPIVVNGKLVTYKGKLVRVQLSSNYKIVFTQRERNGDVEIHEDGDEILLPFAESFSKKYVNSGIANQDSLSNYLASIDPFTQSIVLKSGLYEILLDRNNERHLHDGQRIFAQEVNDSVKEFVKDLTVNYYELFTILLNRRLMGAHMSPIIKGHLVAGLFQPLVVQSTHLDSPFKLGEFDWFFKYLNELGTVEEYLERRRQTNRGLDLSVVSMYDLSQRFNTPIVRDMSRVHWMLMLCETLLLKVAPQGTAILQERYSSIHDSIQNGEGSAYGTDAFFYNFVTTVRNINTQLAVRR